MSCQNLIIVLAILPFTSALWSCTQDLECSSLSGSVCTDGECVCPPGNQSVLGGTVCVESAPYHTSACVEDHQCSRLVTTFECRRAEAAETGDCRCQAGHHYFLGRCWPTTDYGASCVRDEECLSTLRDPFSLTCNGTCGCAEGFYERQRGECRRIAAAPGDGCVLDQDCQFDGGVCVFADPEAGFVRICRDNNAQNATQSPSVQNAPESKMAARQHGVACGPSDACAAPFICSQFSSCICPRGYYASDNGSLCLAELGSPATDLELCTGFLAVVRDGICTCPPNFYFEENMRDCVRPTLRISDSCVTDANCHTFGTAARCGAPQLPWGLRSCECIPELAVWDAERQMCRLFVGIGESCRVDSECLAGDLVIPCVLNEEGEGFCQCPEGTAAADGLCLTTGLALGEACQVTEECTATPNTVCEGGRCSCDGSGYQELDGACAPVIGGVCMEDSDCVIENTRCFNLSGELTCQCREQFVGYADACWSAADGIEARCNVTAQCVQTLGEASSCQDGRCLCADNHHHRDGACWPVTGLFESCSRTSQCYHPGDSNRVVCRNSMCQCDFQYPFSEELRTCMHSSATSIAASFSITLLALIKLFFSL